MANKKLIIEVREEEGGKVYVTGPLQDKKLCRAMLEEAISIVEKFKPTIIATPNANFLKGLNGKS